MKTDTILTIAAVVAGGYVVYKLTEPLTKSVGGVGDAVVSITDTTADTTRRYGEALGSYADIFNSLFDRFKDFVSGNKGKDTITNNTTYFNSDGSVKGTGNTVDTKPTLFENEKAQASAAALYSGATYNDTTGILIDKSGKGYSVMPSKVPSLLKSISGIQTVNTLTGKQSTLKPSLFISK